MSKIRVAFCGIGNGASAIIQGIKWYKKLPVGNQVGLIHQEVGGYEVTDIMPVAAFDVDERKVGKELSEAIYAEPNNVVRLADVPPLGVEVMMGPNIDGVDAHLARRVKMSSRKPCDVVAVLQEAKPDVVINLLPTGAIQDTRYYAESAMEGVKASFINGMPTPVANNDRYVRMAERCGVSLIGDDVKSQVGSTALSRSLVQLFLDKGVQVKNIYQLNTGGDSDFFNMAGQGAASTRMETKLKTKIESLKRLVPYEFNESVGVSFTPFLNNTKVSHTFLKGVGYSGCPVTIEVTLRVCDGPNFAGVMIDAIRCCKLAMDRGVSGLLTSASAFLMKWPPVHMGERKARQSLDEFINGKRER